MLFSWLKRVCPKRRTPDASRKQDPRQPADVNAPKRPVGSDQPESKQHLGPGIFLDLGLPKDKQPADVGALKQSFGDPQPIAERVFNYAIGSSNGEQVYHKKDLGLFQTVLEVWKNHWVLRTRPDDWWFPVACRIAKAIDKEAQRENVKKRDEDKPVRNLFVGHEQKQDITVEIPVYNIYQVDHEPFFQSIAGEVEKRIKIPNFAKVMQNDFSSSKVEHKIESQINLMASVQQFFEFQMALCGCGINGVELLGEQNDWDRLTTKLKELREILKPVQCQLGLHSSWFDHVEKVFQNLAKSYALATGNDKRSRPELEQFWADILCDGWGVKYYGPSGMQQKQVEEYDGWLIEFLTGLRKLKKEEITPKKLGCLNSVPMKVSLTYRNPVVSDTARLETGMMGFTLHSSATGVPCLEPHHMWAMQLLPHSQLRNPSDVPFDDDDDDMTSELCD